MSTTPQIAYFSTEIALTVEIPTYSGLGVLAGDFLKSAPWWIAGAVNGVTGWGIGLPLHPLLIPGTTPGALRNSPCDQLEAPLHRFKRFVLQHPHMLDQYAQKDSLG